MFEIQWLRRFFRRHTAPIPFHSAHLWKRRLSIAYMFFAWNAFGVVIYNVCNGKSNWASYHGLPTEEGTPAQQWTRTLGIKEAKVFRVAGLNVEKYEIRNEFDEDTKEVISSKIYQEVEDDSPSDSL